MHISEGFIGQSYMFGGDGDDTWVNTKAYGERGGQNIGGSAYFGNSGNDYITSAHETTGRSNIYGG